jgi:gliding motility-associated-like protein
MILNSFTKAIKGISFITAGVLSLSALPAAAQLMTNNGAMVYVNTGAVMYVDGDYHNLDSITINLGSQLNVRGNFINDAQFGGDGSPLPGNNGLTIVGGDWENNTTLFYPGTGKVLLDGALQDIKGQQPSHFYHLELAGTDRKQIQETDQFVGDNGTQNNGTLILNDRELSTNEFTMHVENPAASAITRTTGFVSSLVNGSLSRITNNPVDYLFPVGSNLFFTRYRPAKIRPTTSLPNRFTVRLVNANPSTDDPNDPNDYPKSYLAHDNTICYVDSIYWYKINHPEGIDNADLSLSYNQSVPEDEGAYNGIVQWDNITDNQWENIGTTASVGSELNGDPDLIFVRKNAVNSFSPEPFTLSYKIPPPPPLSGESVICADVVTTYSVIPNPNATYEFYVDTVNGVPTGVIISTTANSATVIWNDMDWGNVYVIETIDNQNGYVTCPSLIGNFLVDILSLPAAIFGTTYEYPNPNPNGTYGYTNPDAVFINDLISFHDSSTNTISWAWDFNDGVTSVNQNPYHTYSDLGTYNVMMVATSPDGCLDTAYKAIDVVEGLVVPNVFTPNGDGYNDVFKIRNSAVSEFTFRVFNRWGTQIYETTAPEIAWDGKTQAGSAAPAGTYFYTLKAKLASGNDIAIFQDAETLDKGNITLIR